MAFASAAVCGGVARSRSSNPAGGGTASRVASRTKKQGQSLVKSVKAAATKLSAQAADVLADIDFGDEAEDTSGGSRMTVSGSTAGLSGEGIMDRPWFWPVVIAGGIGAVVYLRRK